MQDEKEIKRFRNTVLALLFLGWFLGNLDRQAINYAIVDIAQDFNLNSSATGVILSSFFLGYAIMQVPGGWLADKFGSKKILLVIITAWSFFTALTGLAGTLSVMIVSRFAFGLSEGSFFPSASKMISQVFPVSGRGKAMSILLSAGALIAVFAPVFVTSMMVSVGWRWLFIIIGLIGGVVAILYWVFLKNGKGSEQQIADGKNDEQDSKPSISFKQILRDPLIWKLFIAYFASYTINWGLASWIPTYLVTVRNLDLSTLGYIMLIPAAAALLGMYLTGIIVDKLPQGRDKLLAVIALIGIAVLLMLMYWAETLTIYVIFASLQMFLMSVAGVVLPTIPLKYMPSDVVGKTSGIMNTGGQLAGFVTPLVIGVIVDAFGGSFFAAFAYMAIFAVIGIIATLSMRLKSVEKPIESPAMNS